MVKKLKVVDVVENEEAAQPVQEVPATTQEEKPVEEAPQEEVEQVEPTPEEKPTEEQPPEIKPEKEEKLRQYITCKLCNKQFLAKSFKYSHQKLCLSRNQPPPPPPPPSPPTPEPKPKRITKPKEKKPIEQNSVQEAPKTQFNGVVSFNEFQPAVDAYVAMREQRHTARLQRVKSLISQAV